MINGLKIKTYSNLFFEERDFRKEIENKKYQEISKQLKFVVILYNR